MNTVCIVSFGSNQALPNQESPRPLTGRRDSRLHFAKGGYSSYVAEKGCLAKRFRDFQSARE